MLIDSIELKASLGRMLDGNDDLIGKSFDRGIQTAIKLVIIYEEKAIVTLDGLDIDGSPNPFEEVK